MKTAAAQLLSDNRTGRVTLPVVPLKGMVNAGEIYHPLRWSPSQAMQFLKDPPAVGSAGVVVCMPASWRMNRPPARR